MNYEKQSQIRPHHRNRLAVVYARQSSVRQCGDRAGLDAQRAQSSIARTWGWRDSAIQVIEEKVGRNSSEERPGWLRLLDLVREGRVGLVLVTDLSRLSRSESDLRTFRDLCDRTKTLLAVNGVIRPDPASAFFRSILDTMQQYERALRTERRSQAQACRQNRAMWRPSSGESR